MTESEGKEPTPWELMRGIDRIEGRLTDIQSGTMTAAVFAVEKAALVELIAGNRGRISELDTRVTASDKNLDAYKQQVEEQRGKIRLLVYGLIAGPLITLLVTFVAAGGLTQGGV